MINRRIAAAIVPDCLCVSHENEQDELPRRMAKTRNWRNWGGVVSVMSGSGRI
jgi:hypothetical protein